MFRFNMNIKLKLFLWYIITMVLTLLFSFSILYYLLHESTLQTVINDLYSERYEMQKLLESDGIDAVCSLAIAEAESEGVDKVFVRILNYEMDVISQSNMDSWGYIPLEQEKFRPMDDSDGATVERLRRENSEEIQVLHGTIGKGYHVQMGQSLGEERFLLQKCVEIFSKAVPVFILVAGLLGWFVARSTLSGIQALTRTAQEISRGHFHRRVEVRRGGSEIEKLAETFNAMLERIESLIAGMRQVTEGIAHDLKSPISRIRGTAEMNIETGCSQRDCEEMAGNTIEECDRLLEMINALLQISEAESGAMKIDSEFLDVSYMIRNACALYQASAENKAISLETEAPEYVSFCGDKRRLQRMIANILDNAVKYTPEGGRIRVVLEDAEDRISITVADTGAGIAAEDLHHIFERLYRGDRSRTTPGHGLGLSLAQAVAFAHGGEILVESTPGKGSTFTVILPRPESR